jgi:hypothetical protein
MVLTLSQWTRVLFDNKAWSSWRIYRSQQASAMLLATMWYSASSLDRETMFYHLEDQETRLAPRNRA